MYHKSTINGHNTSYVEEKYFKPNIRMLIFQHER